MAHAQSPWPGQNKASQLFAPLLGLPMRTRKSEIDLRAVSGFLKQGGLPGGGAEGLSSLAKGVVCCPPGSPSI